MNFNFFKHKKKKPKPKAAPPPKAPPPKAAPPEPRAPPAAPQPPQPPQEAAPPNRPRPCIPGGAYMDELDRMSRVPGIRNLEVTTSRTLRWNFKDPRDGCDHEYSYQDQGPSEAHWGGMQRPPALPPYGPPGPMVSSSQPYQYDYGHAGAPSIYSYPHGGVFGGGGYHEDENPHDCVVM